MTEAPIAFTAEFKILNVFVNPTEFLRFYRFFSCLFQEEAERRGEYPWVAQKKVPRREEKRINELVAKTKEITLLSNSR